MIIRRPASPRASSTPAVQVAFEPATPAVQPSTTVADTRGLQAIIGDALARQLAELRRQFNPTCNGGWGIFYDTRSGWSAVRSGYPTLRAHTAAGLRDLLQQASNPTGPPHAPDVHQAHGLVRQRAA